MRTEKKKSKSLTKNILLTVEEEKKRLKTDLFKTEVYLDKKSINTTRSPAKKISYLPDIKIKEVKCDILPNFDYAYSKDNMMKYMSAFTKVKPRLKFKK